MKFARSFNGQGPEFHDWVVSDIPGSAVPTGTPQDTSKPAIAVTADGKVAVAYLFNFAKDDGTGFQHDVILITGQLASTGTGVTWDAPFPTRLTNTPDNARRVTAAYDHAGVLHLAWEDTPAGATASLIRYLEVGSTDG